MTEQPRLESGSPLCPRCGHIVLAGYGTAIREDGLTYHQDCEVAMTDAETLGLAISNLKRVIVKEIDKCAGRCLMAINWVLRRVVLWLRRND